ncbi:hypothetical protein ACX27_20025 [Nostoc piscinale CENA21]|uniref:Uncharacterized protein n=1 Tax=Nostoc piscinale CENA21 TaxID=224013 RepID=A0A0M4SN39_9NOSO|nr:hypothetical protein [Nostoc piscinale]ALF54610.1 hypothetical protein ACX27_20025 [Nostoc piscinale CENA21]
MADTIKPNPNEATTHDAQLAAENMASGDEKLQKVDFDADYAAAQQFSVSEIDRTPEGEAAAQAATAPKLEVPEAEDRTTEAQPTGNPDDYLGLAKEVGRSDNEGVSNVSDDLVKQAIEKGQPKK